MGNKTNRIIDKTELKHFTVSAFLNPYSQYHDKYQEYYIYSINIFFRQNGGHLEKFYSTLFPSILKLLWMFKVRLKSMKYGSEWIQSLIDYISTSIKRSDFTPSNHFSDSVSQFLFKNRTGEELKFCIDSMDSPNVCSQKLLEWCDLYFKSNYWENFGYSEKVLPIVNGNPKIIKHLKRLRYLRNVSKDIDICFIVRVRGGFKKEEGVEHNIRLLEKISEMDCNKYLKAIILGDNVKEIIRRLESKNISWTTTAIPLNELWDISSRSKINIIRLGMHYCTSWRTLDMLAMGACMVLDHSPFSTWPVPLKENINYLNLNIDIGPNTPIGPKKNYLAIPYLLNEWLSDIDLLQRIYKSNYQYFDHYAAPEMVGKYIVEKIEKFKTNLEKSH